MRLYYIFSIKDDVYNTFKNDPENLYTMLNSIYKLEKNEAKLGFKMFEKTCKFLEKKNINSLIKNLNFNNMSYTCFRDTHIINDFYKDESTKLIVNNSHMLLKTNITYPSFFNELKHVKNAFVCDFINEDCFFLKKLNLKSKCF